MTRRTGSVLWVCLLLLGCAGAYFVCGRVVQARADETCARAARYLDSQQPQLASDTLDWLLWFQPDHDVALFLRGTALRQQQRYGEAIEALRQVAPSSHLAQQVRAGLVACLLADYRMETAETELRAFVAEFPENLAVREQLSGLLLAQRRSHEASELWRDVLRQPEIGALSTDTLRRVLRALGRAEFDPPAPQSSIAMLNESLERHPDQTSVLGALGLCHWNGGDPKTAAECFNRLMEFRNLTPRLTLDATQFLIETNELEQATTLFSTMTAPDDESDSARAARYWGIDSLIHDAGGDPQRALDSLERAITNVGNDKGLHARRARLLQQFGRTAEAEQAYSESHRLAQIDQELWNLLRSMEEIPSNDEIDRVARLYADRGDQLTSQAWTSLLSRR